MASLWQFPSLSREVQQLGPKLRPKQLMHEAERPMYPPELYRLGNYRLCVGEHWVVVHAGRSRRTQRRSRRLRAWTDIAAAVCPKVNTPYHHPGCALRRCLDSSEFVRLQKAGTGA